MFRIGIILKRWNTQPKDSKPIQCCSPNILTLENRKRAHGVHLMRMIKSLYFQPCVPEPADKVDDPLGFRVLMSKFFELCSNCNAHATVAIVKVTLPGKEARTMVFKNTPEPNYTRAESNFIKWYEFQHDNLLWDIFLGLFIFVWK